MKQIVHLSAELIKRPEFWSKEPERFYYSGHCHRGSAIETDDDCGNCDGARCDTCRKIIVKPHYSFSCYTDTIYADLKAQGLDDDIAADLAYNDFGCRTHTLHMPTEMEMPEETKALIETPCKEVWEWCFEHCAEFPNEFKDTRDKVKYSLYNMKEAYRKMMQAKGISWDEGLDFYLSQIEFWYNKHDDDEYKEMFDDCDEEDEITSADLNDYMYGATIPILN